MPQRPDKSGDVAFGSIFGNRPPPDYRVTRDGHPLRPFIVVRRGEPIERFRDEDEAFIHAHQMWKVDEALKIRARRYRGVHQARG